MILDRKFTRKLVALVLALVVPSAIVLADSGGTIGAVGPVDSTLTTLDAATQMNLRNSGSLGANDAAAQSLNNCGASMAAAQQAAAQRAMIAATPADPVKGFNDAIGSCLENIETLTGQVGEMGDISSFLNFPFTQLLDSMMQQLEEKVLLEICQTASNTWNHAVNNAISTLNTGTNTDGLGSVSAAAGLTAPASVESAPLFAPASNYASGATLGTGGTTPTQVVYGGNASAAIPTPTASNVPGM